MPEPEEVTVEMRGEVEPPCSPIYEVEQTEEGLYVKTGRVRWHTTGQLAVGATFLPC